MKRIQVTQVVNRRSCCRLSPSSRCLSSATAPATYFRPLFYAASQYHCRPFGSSRSLVPTRHASTTASSSVTEILKTPLYDLHLAHGAKMVPFGGYYMPVQYESLSVSASHHFTRSHASLFDVSHMVQTQYIGDAAAGFLERITPCDITGLALYENKLSTFLHPDTGGIVDDCIITKLGHDSFYVVTNAGCMAKDKEYIKQELAKWRAERSGMIKVKRFHDWGLLALQGPLSEEVLAAVVLEGQKEIVKALGFGQCTVVAVQTSEERAVGPLLVSRGGYTGEDGFEISIPPLHVLTVTELLLRKATPEKLQLGGLGARDSLRLEAGLCLYGHDLDDTTTPVEASLSWIVGKDRRVEGGFHGADAISKQMVSKEKGGIGVERRRVGLIVEGAPAREGAEIVNGEGQKIGNITSGCPSPTLGKNIAMGYIKDRLHKAGTEVDVVVRGKNRKAKVTKMPFVPAKYKRSEEKRKVLSDVRGVLPELGKTPTATPIMRHWQRVEFLELGKDGAVCAVMKKPDTPVRFTVGRGDFSPKKLPYL